MSARAAPILLAAILVLVHRAWGQGMNTDVLKVAVECRESEGCHFVGEDVRFDVVITNVGDVDVGFPLLFAQRTGPSIRLVDARTNAEAVLRTRLAPWELRSDFTTIAPGASVSLPWCITPYELQQFGHARVDVTAEVSLGKTVRIGGQLVEFRGRASVRIQGESSSVRATANGLEVVFELERRDMTTSDDLAARATFTNRSSRPMRVSALFLRYGSILLKVRRADGSPVPSGPPPTPPEDDGARERVTLGPGESVTFSYRGTDLFGAPLESGRYEVRFRHEGAASGEEWAGLLETEGVVFRVGS